MSAEEVHFSRQNRTQKALNRQKVVERIKSAIVSGEDDVYLGTLDSCDDWSLDREILDAESHTIAITADDLVFLIKWNPPLSTRRYGRYVYLF